MNIYFLIGEKPDSVQTECRRIAGILKAEGYDVFIKHSIDELKEASSISDDALFIIDGYCFDDKTLPELLHLVPPGHHLSILVTGLIADDRMKYSLLNKTGEYALGFPVGEEELLQMVYSVLQPDRKLESSNYSLMRIHEAELKGLSRELHDQICPSLAGALLMIENARQLLTSSPSKCEQNLKEVETVMSEVLTDLRGMMNNLNPPGLLHQDLPEAIEQIRSRAEKSSSKTRFSFSHDVAHADIPDVIQAAFYRITKELVFNALKYAQANNVQIRLSAVADEVILDITDDGIGFEPHLIHQAASYEGGRGLHNISQRVQALNGFFEVQTAPGRGTSFHISVKFDPDDVLK